MWSEHPNRFKTWRADPMKRKWRITMKVSSGGYRRVRAVRMKINQSENQQLNTFNRKRKIYIFLFGYKQNPSQIIVRIKKVIEFLNFTADILFWRDGHLSHLQHWAWFCVFHRGYETWVQDPGASGLRQWCHSSYPIRDARRHHLRGDTARQCSATAGGAKSRPRPSLKYTRLLNSPKCSFSSVQRTLFIREEVHLRRAPMHLQFTFVAAQHNIRQPAINRRAIRDQWREQCMCVMSRSWPLAWGRRPSWLCRVWGVSEASAPFSLVRSVHCSLRRMLGSDPNQADILKLITDSCDTDSFF